MEDIFVLFILVVFEFILYITGACIIRIISFGLLKYQLLSYKEFRKLRGKFNKNFFLPYIVGLSFYILLIFVIARLN